MIKDAITMSSVSAMVVMASLTTLQFVRTIVISVFGWDHVQRNEIF